MLLRSVWMYLFMVAYCPPPGGYSDYRVKQGSPGHFTIIACSEQSSLYLYPRLQTYALYHKEVRMNLTSLFPLQEICIPQLSVTVGVQGEYVIKVTL